ncbi:hypothetical protein LDENG_00103560 [Lucifuga dentata]|nr:hypothetical protein LDENG_00103560 [Lucifuga dentata]
MLDKSMSLCHVRQLTRSSFFHLRNIAKLRSVASQAEMEMIIHAFILSHLLYCTSLFTCPSKRGSLFGSGEQPWFEHLN